jgi:hypothetical protein
VTRWLRAGPPATSRLVLRTPKPKPATTGEGVLITQGARTGEPPHRRPRVDERRWLHNWLDSQQPSRPDRYIGMPRKLISR